MSPILKGIVASGISGHLTPPYDLSSFAALGSVTVGSGGASSIEFVNIPQEYKHLQIRYMTKAGNGSYLSMQFNGDTGYGYWWHYFNSTGSGAPGYGSAGNDTRLALPRGSAATNIFSVGIVDIVDYTNTNKNKVVRSIGGRDTGSEGQIDFHSGEWFNTNTVKSISLFHSGQTIPQYSSYALYGVK